jgi:hypothetical protein
VAKKLLGAQRRRWKSRHVDSSDLLPIVVKEWSRFAPCRRRWGKLPTTTAAPR